MHAATHGVRCNVLYGTSAVRAGAAAWVYIPNTGGGNDPDESQHMIVRSRGGRWIRVWIMMKKLHNWRAAWVPPMFRETRFVWTPNDAARFAAFMNESRKDI